MKILSDSNKVIIEADSKKITFRNVFLNKVINIKDIESMYIFNDTMYVLYKQNKLYRKPLARMKLSQKEELKEFVEKNRKENFIFYKEYNAIAYMTIYSIWFFVYAFLYDYQLKLRIIMIFIILIGMIYWVYDCLHCNLLFDCDKNSFIVKKFNGEIKKEIPASKIQFIKEKMTGEMIYLKLPNKSRKILLPKYISAPKEFSSALGDLYLDRNNEGSI